MHRVVSAPWGDPFCVEEVACEWCGNRWTAAHNVEETIECPECHHYTKSGIAIERDQWIDRELSEIIA